MSSESLRELVLRRYAVARDLSKEVERVDSEAIMAVKASIEESETWKEVVRDVDALGLAFGEGYALNSPSAGRWWSASPKGTSKYVAGVGVRCSEVDGRFALLVYTQMNTKIPGLVRGHELRRDLDVAALGEASGWISTGFVGRPVAMESAWQRLLDDAAASLAAHVRFQVTLARALHAKLGNLTTK